MYKIIKRLLDLIIALVALAVLSPLLVISIIILALTGEHEVFYLQKRIGHNSKIFQIWKFATMLKNSSNMGTGIITLRRDPRVTWFGSILRRTKINELPQIINVLKGEMSIVGPRPLMQESYNLYEPAVGKKIYESRPGITGIGSLIFRDEEKILSSAKDPQKIYETIYPYKATLELWYRENASLYVDAVIIFLTAYSLIIPTNNLTHRIFKSLPPRPSFNS